MRADRVRAPLWIEAISGREIGLRRGVAQPDRKFAPAPEPDAIFAVCAAMKMEILIGTAARAAAISGANWRLCS
jgi:hypothetical protein